MAKGEAVTHPDHYESGRKFKPYEVIRDWDLNFNLGSAVKYIARAGRKEDQIEDLAKAIQYIHFEIDALKAEKSKAFPKNVSIRYESTAISVPRRDDE